MLVKAQNRSSLKSAVVLAAGFMAIALYCYFVTRHRIFWSDEALGWIIYTDATWHHMLLAWREGADGGGLAFYVLERVWTSVFGHTVLSARAFSAAGCFLAFATMWFVLRRFYQARFVVLALFLVWFGSENILWQMLQARFYGLLMAAVAAILLATVRSAEEVGTTQKTRVSTLALTFIATLVLVETHPLGLAYSALLVLSAVVADRLSHRRRPLFYAAAVLAWPFLIFSREALVNSSKVGKPWFWTLKPHLHDLPMAYIPFGMSWLPYVVVVVLCLTLPMPQTRSRIRQAFGERAIILVPMVAFLLVPVVLWLVSQHGTAFFEGRYMLPLEFGIAVLVAEAFTQVFAAVFPDQPVASRLAFNCLAAFLLLCTVKEACVDYPHELALPPYDFTPALEAQIPRGLPVVFERFDVFDLEITKGHPPDFPMFYLLDWQVALDPESPRGVVSINHLMENWKKIGYHPDSIRQSEDFLAKTDRFIVVHYDRLRWFDRRVANQPEWNITKVGEIKSEHWPATILLVERR